MVCPGGTVAGTRVAMAVMTTKAARTIPIVAAVTAGVAGAVLRPVKKLTWSAWGR